MRVVHYINQFFAGVGGEDQATARPERRDGAIGPGRRLDSLLGDEHTVVATVFCGDDVAASDAGAIDEIIALIRDAAAEMVLAGPAFGSGRYGIACARVAAAARGNGMIGIAAMAADNPGVAEAGQAVVVASGDTAREMGPSLERFADVARRVAAGEPAAGLDGVLEAAPRRVNRLADRSAAARAVDLALARLGGDRSATEIPLPDFGDVVPAPPIEDAREALVALVSEGAVVPMGNPDRLESARARKWLRYPLAGLDSLAAGEYQSVHGGFSTVAANADPNRILPVDAARELERSGRIGALYGEYLVTAGNGTSVKDAERFGSEWADELRRAGVRAAILTAT
jgi:glycine reductase